MAWVAVAVAGTNLIGGIMSSDAQRSAGNAAADAQSASAQAGIAESQRQFDAIQKLLQPFVTAGTGALGAQQNLIGLNGNDAQKAAIDALRTSPQFTSALNLGENRILANASATGGLRGGNVQAALAQFSPALLASTINDQYNRLGGLTSLGQNAAAGVGNAGLQTGSQVAQLLQQQGAAQAGGALSAGRAQQGLIGSLGNATGMLLGLNGFGGGNPYTSPNIFGSYANPAGSGVGIDPGGFLGGAGSAGDFSDARLKVDIKPHGRDDCGLTLYSWRYRWGGPRQIGYMAHEVAALYPAAVSTHESGFLAVDYDKVH